MAYCKSDAMKAWKTFVGTGELLEGMVRPEIGRSWTRCWQAGVNPWSSNFSDQNPAMLKEKREKYAKSLKANLPVMKFLMGMVGCNVSLMDGENFVFELLTPLSPYPRTYGTFMREEEVGTGNATIVAYEKKPVRVDGFEHYRTISQSYSGVSAPFLDEAGKYYGALNMNSPFEQLPASALALCEASVELANELFRKGPCAAALLSTVDFFKPLTALYEKPVLLLDGRNRILGANAPMRPYCPDWEQYPYGSQSIDAYLAPGMQTDVFGALSNRAKAPISVKFRKGKSRSAVPLNLLSRRAVDINGQETFFILVFEDPAAVLPRSSATRKGATVAGGGTKPSSRRVRGRVDYIGESDEWKRIDSIVSRVAPIKTNVLILGETGTGKEVVARALHRRSGRKGPFVAVNCGALPRDLLATELFGYEDGAFTGAREGGSAGKFEYADGGTLFLDEIGEMPVDMQVSLLRVLQERSVVRLGSNTPKEIDLRVVAATNQDIQRLIEDKRFRSDLYYRLSMVEICLPELRRRPSDIPLLVEHFNKELSGILDVPCSPFPEETLAALKAYSWPGNVRELRNVVERSLIMQGEGGNVTIDALAPHIANAANTLGLGLQ